MIKKIFGIILILILLSPLLMYLVWAFSSKKQLNVLILDKSVIETKTQEHLSFSWILTNENYVKSNNKLYDHKKDYLGIFPNDSGKFYVKDLDGFTPEELDSIALNNDLIYISDLYGIYNEEWHEKYPDVTDIKVKEYKNSGEHPSKLYGGMSRNDLSLLQKMKLHNKLIICEFNVIASPTPNYIRREFEKEFNLQWTGWVGRYFEELDTLNNKELPSWLKRDYLAQNKRSWPFHHSGIVLVNIDSRIVILEDSTHLFTELPIIHTPDKNMKKYGLPSVMKYPFWFDIISTNLKNEIVSTYELDVNSSGKRILMANGIPDIFPAIIENNNKDYRFYYFAGDFGDNPISLNSAKFKWIEYFSSLSYQKSVHERKSFFWEFYKPLMNKILSDCYNNKKK